MQNKIDMYKRDIVNMQIEISKNRCHVQVMSNKQQELDKQA